MRERYPQAPQDLLCEGELWLPAQDSATLQVRQLQVHFMRTSTRTGSVLHLHRSRQEARSHACPFPVGLGLVVSACGSCFAQHRGVGPAGGRALIAVRFCMLSLAPPKL